jgi:hypothetical protein
MDIRAGFFGCHSGLKTKGKNRKQKAESRKGTNLISHLLSPVSPLLELPQPILSILAGGMSRRDYTNW